MPKTPYRLAIAIALALTLENGLGARDARAHSCGVQVKTQRVTQDDLRQIADAGFSFVRFGLRWHEVESEPGVMNWHRLDQVFSHVAQAGLKPLVVVISGDMRDGRDPPVEAEEMARFVRFAGLAAQRYASYQPVWEIWNEPDHKGFWPQDRNPRIFLRLLTQTCQTMRSAAPDSLIVGPAWAHPPIRPGDEMEPAWSEAKPIFRAVMDSAEIRSCLDAISLHPYRPSPAQTAQETYHWMRQVMRERGGGRVLPLVTSEWGYSAHANGNTPEHQARMIPGIFKVGKESGVALSVLYEWQDSGEDPQEREHGFGLKTWKREDKPAYEPVRAALNADAGVCDPADSVRQTLMAASPRP